MYGLNPVNGQCTTSFSVKGFQSCCIFVSKRPPLKLRHTQVELYLSFLLLFDLDFILDMKVQLFQGDALLLFLMRSPLSAYLSAREKERHLSSLFGVWISVKLTVWSVLHGVRWRTLSALGGPRHWSMLSQHPFLADHPDSDGCPVLDCHSCRKAPWSIPLLTVASDIFPHNSHLTLSQLSHQ